jgi:N-formylglutamate deformylase
MIVVHVPHSATLIPGEVRQQIVLDDEQLADELLCMTDWYVDELFALPIGEALACVYPVSRLVCDPERFENDDLEPMAQRGMGVIYTATHTLGTLRPQVTPTQREDLLERYYRPHHRRLTEAVAQVMRSEGRCLIVDAHSYPSLPLPYELDQTPAGSQPRERPAICLGTDDYHTPPALRAAALAAFSARFDSVVCDEPFSGALVPAAFWRCEPRVHSIMVEVRRDLYMDEKTGARLGCFGEVAACIAVALRELDRLS